MKLLTVVGARPQFVKSAALTRATSRVPGIEEVVVHTGQHFDANMSDVHFDAMQLRSPQYNLAVGGLSHGAMTGRMLERIEEVLLRERPDFVIVYGDTNSTLAGALAARKQMMTVVHVEAGLRSSNMRMPEEVNRVVTDRVSNLLFCPTETAVRNLVKEGFREFDCEIHRSGDVMRDVALYYSGIAAKRSRIVRDLRLREFILCTIHRQENTDEISRLSSIMDALNTINRELPVVCPMHPRTRRALERHKIATEFTVTEPVGYLDMLELVKHCAVVVTDSGGLQKEAFFFGKHCVTLRRETEWLELVNGGFSVLADADCHLIVSAVAGMRRSRSDFTVDLYGNGDAAEKIVATLVRYHAARHRVAT